MKKGIEKVSRTQAGLRITIVINQKSKSRYLFGLNSQPSH